MPHDNAINTWCDFPERLPPKIQSPGGWGNEGRASNALRSPVVAASKKELFFFRGLYVFATFVFYDR